MSGISSIGTSSVSQLLQRVSAVRVDGNQSSGVGDQLPAELEQALENASSGSVNFQDLRSKIEAAVQETLQGVDPSSDPQEVIEKIQQTVDQTLKDNGVDPEELKSQLQATFGEGGPFGGGPPPGGGIGGPGGPPGGFAGSGLSATDDDSSTTTDSTNSDETDSSTADLLMKLLNDLFKNFPNGSGFDESA